jgi:L-iditol 2-dehydrogenase
LKALLCYSGKDFRIEEIEKPAIADNEMLIEMLCCGLCGSDIIKIFDEKIKKPDVYGHEVVGKVVEVGRNVDKFKLGDIVVAAHRIPCGKCHYCKHGNHSMCKQFKETSIVPGGFSQYIMLSDKQLNSPRIPNNRVNKTSRALTVKKAGLDLIICAMICHPPLNYKSSFSSVTHIPA